jgi:hypothetical protein
VKAQTEVLLGTSWGTIWELGAPFENLMGTWKRIKNSSPTSPKGKKWTPHEGMLSLIIGCMKLLFPKLFVTIFSLC